MRESKSLRDLGRDVIDVISMLETWSEPYRLKNLRIAVSSLGRVEVELDGKTIVLSSIESVQLIKHFIDALRNFKIITRN